MATKPIHKRKTRLIAAHVTLAEFKRIEEAATAVRMSKSQWLMLAVDEKLARLAQSQPTEAA